MVNEPRKILLFEENYESMRDLKEYLEDEFDWSIEITAEENVLSRLGDEEFDLILVDLMIHPKSFDANENEVNNVSFEGVNWKKTGLEFLRRFRRGEYYSTPNRGTPPDVPVIILSAVANFLSDDEFKERELAQYYVEKPFKLDDLVEQICRLVPE